MHPEFDLFGDAVPKPELPAVPLQVKVTGRPHAKLSPAQQRFNKLLSRIDKLTEQNLHVNTLLDRFRPGHLQALESLSQQTTRVQKDMLLFLHDRLQRKGLTAPQHKSVRAIVKSLLMVLEPQGDPHAVALFDLYHSEEDKAERAQEEAQSRQELKAMLEEMAGRPLDDLDTDQSPEDMLKAALQGAQQEQLAQQQKREARRAKRPPTARQRAAEQQQLDAKSSLRTIFRQLASALHPDRETDPAERARKTALMSEVNAAYGRNDLGTMLRLQLQIAQLDAGSIARMTDETLASMSVVLKEQVSTLESELSMVLHRAEAELGVSVSPDTPEGVWVRCLDAIQAEMRDTIVSMQDDLARVQDDAQLKRWAKEQNRMAQQMARDRNGWDDFAGL